MSEWSPERLMICPCLPKYGFGVCGCQALAPSLTHVSTFLQLFLKRGVGNTCRAGKGAGRSLLLLSLELHNQELHSVLLKKSPAASFSDAALVQPLTCYPANSVKSWLPHCENSKARFYSCMTYSKKCSRINTWLFIVNARISPNHRLINRIRCQTIFKIFLFKLMSYECCLRINDLLFDLESITVTLRSSKSFKTGQCGGKDVEIPPEGGVCIFLLLGSSEAGRDSGKGSRAIITQQSLFSLKHRQTMPVWILVMSSHCLGGQGPSLTRPMSLITGFRCRWK